MNSRRRSRPFVALIAAYVVALQAVLLPLSVVAAGPYAVSLCAAQTTAHGAPQPSKDQNGCPCAGGCGMLCGAHAVLPPDPLIAAVGPEIFGPAPMPALRSESIVCAPDWRPQSQRAPPRA